MLGFFFGLGNEPLTAEKLFSVDPINISNSMLFGVITAVFVVGFLLVAAKRSRLKPISKLTYAIELLVDFIWSVAIGSFGGDRKKALKHLPLLGTLFIFILISNLSGSGLLPGVGTITAHTGEHVAPLLRPLTTDLNATLSMAILTIGLVQFYALRELGLKKHLRHYFSVVFDDKPFYNPMNLLIGLIEIFGELLRIVTLSMRLFGVIYAGEVLISAVGDLSGNFAWFATVPTVLLEIFFSIIQAYVFMMLTATYLSVATGGEHEKHQEVKATN